jgi:trimethylamine--corrinoid protein Co-methyltransferase
MMPAESNNTNEIGIRTSGIHPGLRQRFEVLNQDDLDQIHATTLKILETTGVRFDQDEALDLFRSAGALVENNLVYIPPELIEDSINKAPAQVTLYARDPAKNLYLGRGNVHFSSGFGATWVFDENTSCARYATLNDLVEFTRLADALELVHMVLFAVVPQDVPPRLLDVICTATVLENTSKHVQLSLERAELLDDVLKIGRIIAGPGNPPPFSAGGVPNSPLHYSKEVATKFIRLARENVPCFIVCGAMAGVTAPVTLAGLLTVQNAEILAGITLCQLANPGSAVIYGTFSGGFDMHHTKMALGGPEVSLITCASQQLCDRYGVPLGYATGGGTDSPTNDFQAGMETTLSALSAALAGVDVIHDGISGILGSGMISSLPLLIAEHECCSAIGYFLQGIPISEENLALEVTQMVGPTGSYLTNKHTARSFRKSLFLSSMRARNEKLEEINITRSIYLENAAKQTKKILADYSALPLTELQLLEIKKIVEATKHLVMK